MKSKQKLYCYVDETGQDTIGKFFIVSVVVSGETRETLAKLLEQIEKDSHKGKAKWIHARSSEQLSYMKAVLSEPLFKQKLRFSFYQQTKAYTALTILSTARAIHAVAVHNRAVSVYVDGLPQSRVLWFGVELRHLGVRVSKVVGVRREESSSLIRLADACCGFVRQALVGNNAKTKELFEHALKEGYLKEL